MGDLMMLIVALCSLIISGIDADRIVLKADVVRDFSNMCYDVKNCVPRLVNDSWNTGECAMARCERHESGMLLEVHYTCPRIPSGASKCEMIEDRRQPFPACCPRIICAKSRTFSEVLREFEKKVKDNRTFGNLREDAELFNDAENTAITRAYAKGQ